MKTKKKDLSILVVGAAGKLGAWYLEVLIQILKIEQKNIFAVDSDPVKLQELSKVFPRVSFYTSVTLCLAALKSAEIHPACAFITVNTPAHHPVIIECLESGIKYLFVEKPLALHTKAIMEIRRHLKNQKIFVAFLANFSEGTDYVKKIMKKEKLFLAESSMFWRKDRASDSRPTVGSLEDELPHTLMLALEYAGINQQIQAIDIQAHVSYLSYAHRKIQLKAKKLNPETTLHPSCTATVFQTITTNRGVTYALAQSTFLSVRQSRMVYLTLSSLKTKKPKYLVEIDATSRKNSLRIKKVGAPDDTIQEFTYDTNKIHRELEAFLTVVKGGRQDPRLTEFEHGALGVALTEAAQKSQLQQGKMIRVQSTIRKK